MSPSGAAIRRWTVRLLDWLVWRPLAWCTRQGYRWSRWALHPATWWRFFGWVRFSHLSLRRWLLVALLALVVIPGIGAGVVAIGITFLSDVEPSATERMLRDPAANWTDPAWQAALGAQAERDAAQVVLYQNDQQIYRSPGVTLPFTTDGSGFISVVPGDSAGQTAAIRVPGDPQGDRYLPVPISYVVFMALTFLGIALFFGRAVVKPLAATSAAAGAVAGGNLDIALPSSRVREVQELNAAFEGMAAELKASLDHEARLEEERRQFIGAVAHDLRTPLFALRGSFEAIETGVADTPEKQRYYFELARDRADALDRLISDLFEYTRLEYLDLEPERTPVDLGGLVQRVAETLQPRAAAQDTTIMLDIRPEICTVSADMHMLTRAVDNLVDNALRYAGQGSTIWIEVLPAPGGVVVSVADDGPGIAPDDLPHLFTPLYRGESSRNRQTGGAGLGLTIARRILEAHGGTLTVRNRTPHGSMFIGSVPCERTR